MERSASPPVALGARPLTAVEAAEPVTEFAAFEVELVLVGATDSDFEINDDELSGWADCGDPGKDEVTDD